MKTEPKYRLFEEVVDSAKLDMTTLSLEGMIDPQSLLRTVIKINYDLGLKISPTRTKMLELTRGKVKLPADFKTANFALLCDGRTDRYFNEEPNTYSEGVIDGLLLADEAVAATSGFSRALSQFTTTRDLQPGPNIIEHNLGSTDLVMQASTSDGEFSQYRVLFLDENRASVISDAGMVMSAVKLVFLRGQDVCQPGAQPQVLTSKGRLMVRYDRMFGKREEYHTVEPLRFKRSQGVSAECLNLFQNERREVTIQAGFLITSVESGNVLLSYQSVLEDENGNLLTLDHPKVNDWYDYAIKAKIYENLLLNGEDVAQRLQYIQQQLRPAKTEALSFINTPDFADLQRVWEMNRKAMTHKYYQMFRS